MSPPAHRDTEPPPSERSGRRDSVSESDMRELLERQADKLTKFLDGRARVEGARANREADRSRKDQELRDLIAKMGQQINDLYTKDMLDVAGLHGVREDVNSHEEMLATLVAAEAKRSGAKAAYVAMWAAACVVMPLIYWLLTHLKL